VSVEVIEKRIMELVGGDLEAFAFIQDLWSFVVVWDDAVDRDKYESADTVNNAMIWGLMYHHESPFYIRHREVLRPAMYSMIASWLVANKFEKSGDKPLVEQAYFLRCSPFEVFSLVVFLVSGFEKMMESIEYFRGSFREDTLASYLKEHLEK
jgi:hypothetical protein